MKINYALCLFVLVAPLNGAAAGYIAHGHHARNHQNISRRVDGSVGLWKRISNSRWTFFDVGLGACGKNNVASDFIVALNTAQYGFGSPGPQCFKYITMSYNGKTTKAQIMDECPGCPYGGLDLSRGLFDFFASESKGVIYGSWSFAGGDNDDDDDDDDNSSSTTKQPPKTTHQRTTTSKTSTSTSAATSSSSSVSPTTADYSAGVASGPAGPVATGTLDSQDGNIAKFNAALIDLGGLIVAGTRVG